ncbi:MAG TPA: winged helix-turn-helix domain-containing protein [bacterium]|nr:winged helix-turn-helix domain-containing protein [bacterium]
MSASKPIFGPLTEKISGKGKQKPPPLIREWNRALTEPGDTIVYSAGAYRQTTESEPQAWSSLLVSRADKPGDTFVSGINPDLWELLLSSAAHRQRLEMLKALMHTRTATATSLAGATGMEGGALYYHLRELEHAGLVEQKSRSYQITALGQQFVLTLGGLLHTLTFGPQGKLVSTDWIG